MTRAPRLPPDSRLKAAGHRVRMAATGATVRSVRTPAAAPVSRALLTAAAGRLSESERVWVDRIDARRDEVARLGAERTPDELGVWDVAGAVRWMSVPKAIGVLLLRLGRELRPRSCLELGTGFGLSAAYLAAALELNREGRLITLDVDARLASIASEGFEALELDRVESRSGPGAEVLAEALAEDAPFDLAFIDSDHSEAATLETFESLLPALAPGAVLVFDDVATSWAGMDRAWRRISGDSAVCASRHLGRIAIALMRGVPR